MVGLGTPCEQRVTLTVPEHVGLGGKLGGQLGGLLGGQLGGQLGELTVAEDIGRGGGRRAVRRPVRWVVRWAVGWVRQAVRLSGRLGGQPSHAHDALSLPGSALENSRSDKARENNQAKNPISIKLRTLN